MAQITPYGTSDIHRAAAVSVFAARNEIHAARRFDTSSQIPAATVSVSPMPASRSSGAVRTIISSVSRTISASPMISLSMS